jgi:hypothetical protein
LFFNYAITNYPITNLEDWMEAGDQERSCSWLRENAIGMQHPQGIAIVIMVLHPSVAHAVLNKEARFLQSTK